MLHVTTFVDAHPISRVTDAKILSLKLVVKHSVYPTIAEMVVRVFSLAPRHNATARHSIREPYVKVQSICAIYKYVKMVVHAQ